MPLSYEPEALVSWPGSVGRVQGTDVTLWSAPVWQRTRTTLLNAWRRCPTCHGDCWYLRWVDTQLEQPVDALWLCRRVVMHLVNTGIDVRCAGELFAPADAVLEVSARGVRVAFP